VPFASCLTIFISIYQIVLAYFATKVEHQLTSGRALLTVAAAGDRGGGVDGLCIFRAGRVAGPVGTELK